MKIPHAILISLSLTALAIFFKDTTTPPAHAFGGPDGFGSDQGACYIFKGNTAVQFDPVPYGCDFPCIFNWRTGEEID